MSKKEPARIKGLECRHATHCPTPYGEEDDVHVVKFIVHREDGTTYPFVGLKKNFKRPFWTTKKGLRKHKEKKESELLENLDRFECVETHAVRRIRAALGIFSSRDNRLKQLARSPYLYGTDITSTAILKKKYQDENPNINSPITMAATDTETDVLHGTEEIIMQTISFKDRVFTAIKASFVKGLIDVENELQRLLHKYLGDDVKKRNIKWEVAIVDTAADIVIAVINKAHAWSPDFLAIWNIEFDMNKMLEALQAGGYDPADVFSDPKVPASYRHFTFKLGPAQKIKSDGTATPLTPSQRWHSVTVPGGFTLIDAMCAYRHIRTGSAELPSYGLDYVMGKEIERSKLDFKEAEGYSDLNWHVFMQEKYPLEYVIYNVFDCVGMEILDEKTQDLAISLAMFSGVSDYAIFNSQPKRLCNEFHFYLLEQEGRVLASTSDEMKDENDDKTVNGRGWITMLPAHQVLDNGLKCIKEFSNVPSNYRGHTGDLDVEGSYPNAGMCYNLSKSTTKREIIDIEGVTEEMRRRQGVNLSGGHVNGVEFCCGLMKLPTLEEMYAEWLRDNNQTIENQTNPLREMAPQD